MPLAGCKNETKVPDDLAANPDSAQSFQDELLASLPEEKQREARGDMQRLESELQSDWAKIQAQAGRTQAIGNFVDRRLGYIANAVQSIENGKESLRKIQEGSTEGISPTENTPQGAKFREESTKHKLAIALHQKTVQEKYLKLAIAADSAVAEAHRRWAADTSEHRKRVADIAWGLAYEPCVFTQPVAPGKTPFAIQGVGIGMARDDAVGALCGQTRKTAMFTQEPQVRRTHIDAWKFAGFAPGDQLAELPWSLAFPARPIEGEQEVRFRIAKPFESLLNFCVGCQPGTSGRPAGPTADLEQVQVGLLPNGQVATLLQNQKFAQPIAATNGDATAAGGRMEPISKPLDQLLKPLEARFGKPSLYYEPGATLLIGWVFPDRKTALPLERWFASELAPPNQITLHFRTRGLVNAATGGVDYAKLKAQNPRASYCVNRHYRALGQEFSMRSLGAYDNERQQAETFLSQRAQGMPVRGAATRNSVYPYDMRYERPGFLAKCGVVVVAAFDRNGAGIGADYSRDDLVRPVPPAAPIYRMSLTVIDVDAIQGQFVKEEQQFYEQLPPAARPKAPPPVALHGSVPKDRATAVRLADAALSADYRKWKDCLYTRDGRTALYQDEVRCMNLDPQGRTPQKR